MLTPCAPSASFQRNVQSQNSLPLAMASGARSGSVRPGKKQPALSFSAGQEPSIPTPVKRIFSSSVRNVTVFPSLVKGTASQ